MSKSLKSIFVVLYLLLGSLANASEPPRQNTTRGALLYSNHCIACHTIDIHWRDKQQVSDWRSLQTQVRRWQALAELGWDDDDIDQVTRYLDTLHYHIATPD